MTTLGVVAALPLEVRALGADATATEGVHERAPGVLVCIGGIGPARAREAAMQLAARGAEALVSWGIAGGLDARCRAGDLLLPTAIHTAEGPALGCDARWLQRLSAVLAPGLRVHRGAHLASAAVVRSVAEKRGHAQRGWLGVDMESGAVAQVAHAHGFPVVAVRAVADPASLTVPPSALAGMGPDGRPRPRALLAALRRRPQDTLAVLRLWRASLAALATLRAVAMAAGPRLALEDEEGA